MFLFLNNIRLHAIVLVLVKTTAAVIPRAGSVQSRSGFVRFCRRRRILLHAIIPVLPQTAAAVIPRPGSVQFRLRSFLSRWRQTTPVPSRVIVSAAPNDAGTVRFHFRAGPTASIRAVPLHCSPRTCSIPFRLGQTTDSAVCETFTGASFQLP